ncbi:hypothetical protein Tco_0428345 [Tanacetum coccineum]
MADLPFSLAAASWLRIYNARRIAICLFCGHYVIKKGDDDDPQMKTLRTAKREPRLATQEAIIILSLWADGWFSSWKNSISTCNNDIANIDGCSKASKVLSQVRLKSLTFASSDVPLQSITFATMADVPAFLGEIDPYLGRVSP